MNKAQLVEAMAIKTNQTKVLAEQMLDAALSSITEALQNDDEVKLVGFGTFTNTKRKARQGRNPKTGETVTIPAANNAKFKPGKDLKKSLN